MLEFNGTAIVLAISFIIFTILMNFIFYRPMKKMLDTRNSYITGNDKDASEKMQKAACLIKDRDEKISVAKKEGSEILNKTTLETKQEYEKSVQNKKEIIKTEETELRNTLATEKAKVQNELKSEVAKFSSTIVAKVLGKDVAMVNISDEIIDKALRGEL